MRPNCFCNIFYSQLTVSEYRMCSGKDQNVFHIIFYKTLAILIQFGT